MAEAGISTMVYYPTPVHKLPVYSDLGVSLPLTESAASEVISLPIWPSIPESTQERVAESLLAAVG